jgi:hypothetical protein
MLTVGDLDIQTSKSPDRGAYVSNYLPACFYKTLYRGQKNRGQHKTCQPTGVATGPQQTSQKDMTTKVPEIRPQKKGAGHSRLMPASVHKATAWQPLPKPGAEQTQAYLSRYVKNLESQRTMTL